MQYPKPVDDNPQLQALQSVSLPPEVVTMLPEESVTVWLQQLKGGRISQAELLWQRYKEQLVRLAHRKLGASPRRVSDEEDVVLSAFDGFLRGVADGRFTQLDDRDDLWQVLVMLTERRAIAARRRQRTLKRGGGQVRGESVFAAAGSPDSHRPGLDQVAVREATPEFAAEMTEGLREMLGQLSDDAQRRIALGKLAGYSNQELAQQLGISLRAVERKLGIIRDLWRGEIADE
jgi:RNA polymerase sigma factor (sigma-70 family)